MTPAITKFHATCADHAAYSERIATTMLPRKIPASVTSALGTGRLLRTGSRGHAPDTPGDLKDFIWANNNNRDPAVTREYVAHPENAPYDLAFGAWNRDVAFNEFYRRFG